MSCLYVVQIVMALQLRYNTQQLNLWQHLGKKSPPILPVIPLINYFVTVYGVDIMCFPDVFWLSTATTIIQLKQSIV